MFTKRNVGTEGLSLSVNAYIINKYYLLFEGTLTTAMLFGGPMSLLVGFAIAMLPVDLSGI